MDINLQNKDKIFHRISVDYNKSLVTLLQEESRLSIDDDKVELNNVPPELFAIEMNYLLDNIIPQEDIEMAMKPTMTSVHLKSAEICEYCKTVLKGENDICCPNREIRQYIKNIQNNKLMNQISSFSLVEKRSSLNKRRSNLSGSSGGMGSSQSIAQLSYYSSLNFEKHLGTFNRIKRKMQLIKKFYPEIYSTKESVIDMWARSDLFSLMESDNDERMQE